MASIKTEMKWLILGGEGQLGRAMQAELAVSGINFVSCNHSQLDITSANEIAQTITEEHPSVVLNAAAWTNVDAAENAESSARAVNAHGPELLANACQAIDARFVHISTDYVFSGISNKPWNENSTMDPVSAYGRTKAEGELLVQRRYSSGSFIVRTAWLYSPWGRNFAKTMVGLALFGTDSVTVIHDQIGQPTSALDLATQIHRMINADISPGIYHGTNSGRATWFEFAQYIFERSGTDPDRVIPVALAHFSRPATRPAYSVLSHQRWFDEGMDEMRDWRDALDEALPTIIDAVNLEH